MSKRLVSGYYEDYYPFDSLGMFNSFITTQDPSELQANDVLIIWGGADIHPSLYKKGRSQYSWASQAPSHRDVIEWGLMQRAKELSIPIIGVCRGAQMLCALAGGYLIQHVTGHGGNHRVVTNDGQVFVANSIHHQMMVPDNTNHELIAHTEETLSSVYWDENTPVDRHVEPELVYFNDVKGFAVQWHPEMLELDSKANQYFLNMIEERI